VSLLPTPDVLSEEALVDLLTSVRRHLHQYPEVGFAERETTRYLQTLLADHGFEIIAPLAGTGFAIEIEGAHPGPCVGYRSELDALPTADAKNVSYASRNPGTGHLCGHDAHMAVAVGVALLLNQRREQLYGTVRVIFQPNEESIPTGAPRMIADGAIDGLREIFCIHCDPTLEVGQIGLRHGTVTAGAASWMVHVYSAEAGHSARPHQSIDTIWLANQILSTFYQLPGRVHDARRSAVITACRFHGGTSLNVIPNEVEFGGTLRSIDLEAMRLLSSKMHDAAKSVGKLYGAEVRYEADLGLPPVENDPVLVDVVQHAVEDLIGPEAIFHIPESSMGGEDFAFYVQHIPGALVRVGTRGGPETGYPLHHSCFDIDERALPLAAHVMAETLCRRLKRIV
jgi:amidohydrolase